MRKRRICYPSLHIAWFVSRMAQLGIRRIPEWTRRCCRKIARAFQSDLSTARGMQYNGSEPPWCRSRVYWCQHLSCPSCSANHARVLYRSNLYLNAIKGKWWYNPAQRVPLWFLAYSHSRHRLDQYTLRFSFSPYRQGLGADRLLSRPS